MPMDELFVSVSVIKIDFEIEPPVIAISADLRSAYQTIRRPIRCNSIHHLLSLSLSHSLLCARMSLCAIQLNIFRLAITCASRYLLSYIYTLRWPGQIGICPLPFKVNIGSKACVQEIARARVRCPQGVVGAAELPGEFVTQDDRVDLKGRNMCEW